jgi:hydroxymethylbilane synthase
VPIGAYCRVDGDRLELTGLIASIEGDTIIKDSKTGTWAAAATLGTELADELLAQGGREILAQYYDISAE